MDPVEHSIVIARPIEEVFDVATCQRRCVVWRGPIVATAMTSDGPVGVGSTYRHEVKFLGVKIQAAPQIVAWEPPHRAEIENHTGPVTYHLTFTLDTVDPGTKLTTVIKANIGGALEHLLPDTLLHKAISRQHEGDLQSLKDLLESEITISA